MTIEMTPFLAEQYKTKKLKPTSGFPHAKTHHLTSIVAQEIPLAAANFPVLFTKDEQTGQFRLIALLGLTPGKNLFYAEPVWHSSYIPANIGRYPFGFGGASLDQSDLFLCIDKNCSEINDEEGIPLFNSDGSDSEFLQSIKQRMSNLLDQERATVRFVQALEQHQLLEAHKLVLTDPQGQKNQINGLYSVSAEKLKTLSDDIVLAFHKNGYLQAIHAHLLSLTQFQRLIQLNK